MIADGISTNVLVHRYSISNFGKFDTDFGRYETIRKHDHKFVSETSILWTVALIPTEPAKFAIDRQGR